MSVRIRKNNGELAAWEIGQKLDNYYLARRADRNDIYRIRSEQAEKIFEFMRQNQGDRNL